MPRQISQPLISQPFTCKDRTLVNLLPEEEALAHSGIISPALRERSPVYYWQKTGQPISRREAVCTRKGGWHMASFGSHGAFQDLAAWKCGRMAHKGVPKLDSCINVSLASLSTRWRRAHNVTRHSRGAGAWRWKPYYLLRRLESLAMGDVLVHLDYDLTIRTNVSALYCLGQNAEHGVALFHFPCWTDRQYSKVIYTRLLHK